MCISKCILRACVETNGEGVCHHSKKKAEGRHVSNGCQNGISCSKQKMFEVCLSVRMSKDSREEQDNEIEEEEHRGEGAAVLRGRI